MAFLSIRRPAATSGSPSKVSKRRRSVFGFRNQPHEQAAPRFATVLKDGAGLTGNFSVTMSNDVAPACGPYPVFAVMQHNFLPVASSRWQCSNENLLRYGGQRHVSFARLLIVPVVD